MRRALAALIALVALGGAAGQLGTVVQARAATPPVAVRFVHLLQAARDALPADPQTARHDLDEALSLAPPAPALTPIIAAIDEGTPDRARRLLDDEVAALALPPDAEPGGVAEGRRRLEQVYAQPPLDQLSRPRPSPSLFDRLGTAATNAITWIVDHLGRAGSTAVGLLGALLAAALALWLLARVARRRLARRAPSRAAPRLGEDPDLEWTAALAAAARGDHREAVRRGFRSAVLSVAVRGRLLFDAAVTNRELLARVRGDAHLVAALAPAAAGFERAWYSPGEVTAADWELARARCEAIRSLAAQRSSPPAAVVST